MSDATTALAAAQAAAASAVVAAQAATEAAGVVSSSLDATLPAKIASGSNPVGVAVAAKAAAAAAVVTPEGSLVPPTGQWVLPRNMAVAGTSNTLGASNLRVMPVLFRKATRIDALSVAVTAAGSAGALVRLGIYADDGTGYPGARVVDAGTVAGDAIANPAATFAAITLQPGIYWFGAVLQGTLTTQPTIATPSLPLPDVPIRVGTSPISGSAFGYIHNPAAGALPTSFTTTLATTGSVPRVIYRTAA